MDENRPMTKKEMKAARRLERLDHNNSGSSQDKIKWIILSVGTVVFLAFFAFIIFLIKQEKNKPVAISSDGYIRGGSAAKVTMVEFGDLQCPACSAYEPIVRQLSNTFKNNMKLVYKNFPLTSAHPNAMLAAHVAVAAGNQGKFWEMHDWLYDNQDSWAALTGADARTKMLEAAKAMKLDTDRLNKDADSSQVADMVSKTQNEGITLGVDATPTFYLNDQKVDPNPQTFDEFKKLVQDAENKAK